MTNGAGCLARRVDGVQHGLELVRLANLAVVRFGLVDAHRDAVVLFRRGRVVADDAHRHVVNAGVAVLIERADMAPGTAGVGDRATRRRRLAPVPTTNSRSGSGRGRTSSSSQMLGRQTRRHWQRGLPCRATMPRVPAGMAVSAGMIVVATLPAQVVLAVVTVDRASQAAWPGAVVLAKDVVVALGVAAQHAQAAVPAGTSNVEEPGAAAVTVVLHGLTAAPSVLGGPGDLQVRRCCRRCW